MKHYGIPTRFPRPAAAAFLILAAVVPNSASSVAAGGYIPVLRNLTVTPAGPSSAFAAEVPVEVAVLEIDNNLPGYELALDFSGPDGNGPVVSEVRLEGAGGVLGTGLAPPQGPLPEDGSHPGRFIWSPGSQKTATLGYRIRVLATYADPDADRPPLYVGVLAPY